MQNVYPAMYRIRQLFDSSPIADVRGAIRERFAAKVASGDLDAPRGGQTGRGGSPPRRAAVAVGSRGICCIHKIVAATVECLKGIGLQPFIVPAMGSHGGASADGQRDILNRLGVNEKTVGAPVVSSMDVISLGRLDTGAEIVISKDIAESDCLVVINRVKPHTAFRSDVESGLCKMLAVGCESTRGP